MDPDEYRKRSLETWNRMSTGWHSWRDYMWEVTGNVRDWLINALDPKPGQTILEVAAGVGDTGFTAANLIGDDGRLLSTDFSPGMLDAARKRAEELGVGNAEFKVLDAENMDLDDNSVDGVICRWGYMLMADPAAALAETNRVLKPGGRLAFATWSTPDKNLWAATPAIVLVERGAMPPPEPGAPGIFALADQHRLRELVSGAGFADPKIEEVPITFRYDDLDQHWRATNELAGPIAAVIAGLSDEEQQAVKEEVGSRLEQFKKNGGYEVPGTPIGVAAEG